MAEDASEYLVYLSTAFSSSFSLYHHFTRKTELFSYLLLCVAKMPFIPQVVIARSVSGLSGKERPATALSTSSVAKTKVLGEDKGSSVKERLTLNLKQLGRKNQLKSHLTTTSAVARGRLLPSSQADSIPTSSSGESLPKASQHKHSTHKSVKAEPVVKTRARNQAEARFTLTLTPEAVLLLQRRNSERHQRSSARNVPSAPGSTTDSRRRRHLSRAATKNAHDAELVDISSILKISLLNDKHKYDDVEYEEEDDSGVDEHVVMKCTEWLCGLENKPVTWICEDLDDDVPLVRHPPRAQAK
ncbi:uncharacterized protein [Nothobranchius furzeri]|uniref:uncharacterized protein n=1 Tax=Nothobranchius furzeri TaxID=105023 RepID=UPI0024046DB0|nr:uncharacterized protein LOC129164184 [Nothobranchius furzeri]